MKFSSWLSSVFVISSLFSLPLIGCDQKKNKLVLKPPEVTIAEPVEEEVVEAINFTGTTQASATLDIRARVKGFLDKMLFEPGSEVKKDQLLFVIDPREYQANVNQNKADLDAHKAELEFSSFEVKRLKGLSDNHVAGAYELVQAQSQHDINTATIASSDAALDKAKLDLEYTQITSPIAGRISRNMIDVGNLVGDGENTLLATVVQSKPIYAYFNISERDLLTLKRRFGDKEKKNQTSSKVIKVCLGLFDEEGYPHEGVIDYSDPAIDAHTGTLQVRAEIPNEDGFLIPGMFARIQIPLSKHQALLVPDVAVSADPSGRFLLVVNDQDVVEYRSVKVGILVGSKRVITEGISKSDRVIINGIQRAKPGAKVTPLRLTATTQPAK